MTEAGASAIRAEFRFLLACAESDLFHKRDFLARLISSGVILPQLARIARHHRLIPHLFKEVCDLGDLVPADSLREIRALNDLNVRQTLRLTRDLIRVVKHFQARGIPVLSYKGPVLAMLLYGDFTQRQFSDLDLLVDPADIGKSKAALQELNYTPSTLLSKTAQKYYPRSANELGFHAPDAENVLELQWNILPRFYSIDFDITAFFDRSVNVAVNGYPIPTLGVEDLLLVLSAHAAKHAWSELSLVSDIAQLMKSQPIDWDWVSGKSRDLGIQQIVDLNLELTHELFGAGLPGVRSRKTNRTTALARKVISDLAQNRQMDVESVPYFHRMLSVRERIPDRAQFLMKLIFTPGMGEWKTMRLPPWLFPLYRLLRIYRLALRFGRLVWRKIKSLRTAARHSAIDAHAQTAEYRLAAAQSSVGVPTQ